MNIPRATYRLQFSPEFTFRDALPVIEYLSNLGISHIYASPVFLAKQGSMHGYDIADLRQINPELGYKQDFEMLSDHAARHNLGWIQDIVPNHMAFDSRNELLMELLENGPEALPVHYFDIEWNHPYEAIRGRLLAPFLGDIYGECLERGEIKLAYDRDGFSLRYFHRHFPLRIDTYATVLGHSINRLRSELGSSQSGLMKLLGILYVIKSLPAVRELQERKEQIAFVKSILWEIYTTDEAIRMYIDSVIADYNGHAGDPQSFSLLDALHGIQSFKLTYWKVATEELNYRRFFTVNDLISVRVEDQEVHRSLHELILDLVNQGRISGLRIDHVDGLYDPRTYLDRLRSSAPDIYIVVEKILGRNESLPKTWPVQGTTGYDFLNYAIGVLCEQKHQMAFDRIYAAFSGFRESYETLVADKKRLILGKHMAGDIDNLALLIKEVSGKDRRGTDITMYGLRQALIELLTWFPVYRSYINSDVLSEEDRNHVTEAISRAQRHNPSLTREFAFIRRFLLLQFDSYLPNEQRSGWINVVMRFQQFTGPLMAKGFEDTTLYIYNRMTALNDVGGAPHMFGIGIEQFHEFNTQRAREWQHTMNATATHDTKRGEDTRARIAVLTEIPEEWERNIKLWSKLNQQWRTRMEGAVCPDANDEYLLYQTLIGTWPFQDFDSGKYAGRIEEYMLKAVREAKIHTAWIKPDADYEKALHHFVAQVLDPDKNTEFLDKFLPFQKKIAQCGIYNSLTQCFLKATSPGVPDFYQGTELWDLSLVDPDNRHKVNFDERSALLDQIRSAAESGLEAAAGKYLTSPENGVIKLFLTWRLLAARKEYSHLFQDGAYVPLKSEGNRKRNLIAFARTEGAQWALALATRFVCEANGEFEIPTGDAFWGDATLLIPENSPKHFVDCITGRKIRRGDSLLVAEVLNTLPVALLIGSA